MNRKHETISYGSARAERGFSIHTSKTLSAHSFYIYNYLVSPSENSSSENKRTTTCTYSNTSTSILGEWSFPSRVDYKVAIQSNNDSIEAGDYFHPFIPLDDGHPVSATNTYILPQATCFNQSQNNEFRSASALIIGNNLMGQLDCGHTMFKWLDYCQPLVTDVAD